MVPLNWRPAEPSKCIHNASKKSSGRQLLTLFPLNRLNDLKAKSTTLLAAVQALNVQNEPDKKPDAKFDQKKAAEEKVIKDSVVKLDAQIAKLPAPVAAQPAVEENKSPVKAEAKKAEKKQDEEDEEDEDDEEDEAEEGAIVSRFQACFWFEIAVNDFQTFLLF